MFTNFIRLGSKSLKKNKLFSILNIVGLSVGIGVIILLMVFVNNELTYDSNAPGVYRLLQHVVFNNEKEIWSTSPNALAPAIKAEIPEVSSIARMVKHGFGKPAYIKADQNHFTENTMYYCDEEFVDLFNLSFIQKNGERVFERPNTCIISEELSKKYFNGFAIGKTLIIDNSDTLEITGIYKKFPANSSFDCEIIGSYMSSKFNSNVSWNNASFETFCRLSPNANLAKVGKSIKTICDKNIRKNPYISFEYQTFQPVKEMHLYSSDFKNSYITNIGNIAKLKICFVIALLILVVACINYMNLATAQFSKRTKEFGISKAIGATNKMLVYRVYIETSILTLISSVVGFIVALISLPLFNKVVGQHIEWRSMFSLNILIGTVLIWLLTTILSGAYPAAFLTSLKSRVIGSLLVRNQRPDAIRKILSVGQFSFSIILIVLAFVIYSQLDFIQQKDLGFNPANVVAVSIPPYIKEQQSLFLMNESKKIASIRYATLSQGFPGKKTSTRKLSKTEDDIGTEIQTAGATSEIVDGLGLHLLAGNTLPVSKTSNDSTVQVVLNKAAIDYLGYKTPDEAIGRKVKMQLGNNALIVGVVNNFNFKSVQFQIEPYAFHNESGEKKPFLLLQIDRESQGSVMSKVENLFKKTIPDSPFEVTYLDNYLSGLYNEQITAGKIILIFSLLAIIIASLGLFGLVTFMVEQKSKEIGIRKVLGSSGFGIATFLGITYVRMLLLSFVIAVPVAYFLSYRWLLQFVSKIQLGISIFMVAGFIALIIMFVTISFQIIKAVNTSPVNSLRNE